jgi:hypothetical protein
MRQKSNWAAIPNSSTLIDSLPVVTLTASNNNKDSEGGTGGTPNEKTTNTPNNSIKINLYDIRSLDYGLEDIQVYRHGKGTSQNKIGNFFPAKISFNDPRHERDSLLWVTYASQRRKVHSCPFISFPFFSHSLCSYHFMITAIFFVSLADRNPSILMKVLNKSNVKAKNRERNRDRDSRRKKMRVMRKTKVIQRFRREKSASSLQLRLKQMNYSVK